MSSGITVVIPTIPERAEMLTRAVGSVMAQTIPAETVVVEIDSDATGAPATRDRALRKVTSPWVAFLDDDDWFKPEHLETLVRCQVATGADYVYSYYEVTNHLGQNLGDYDPVLGHFGKVFDPDDPIQTTITTMVRTDLAQQIGFLFNGTREAFVDGQRVGEDYQFTLGCVKAGAKIVHVPRRTWYWSHHTGNTSGRPWNQREAWVD